MEPIQFFLLNTFIGDGLKGNPTPVCLMDSSSDVKTMESLAKKFNCPVSVFINQADEPDVYQIRYFTVTGEIPACGHGTLGAANVLLKESVSSSIKFKTLEHTVLTAYKENGISFIQYPQLHKSTTTVYPEINKALGIHNFKDYFLCKELESLFIELAHEDEVRQVSPDYEKLLQSTDEIKEIVIMAEASSAVHDITLRSFCPWIGINEDPVTGSIHAVLGHHWKNKLEKEILIVNQVSERGGRLIIKPENKFVKIGGDCEILEERVI